MNLHAAETIKGAVTATASFTGLAWLADLPVVSTIGTFATFSLAAFGWWVLRKERIAEAARNKFVADSLTNVQVNQVLITDMMLRLHSTLHPDSVGGQPTVIIKVDDKKP